MTSGFAANAGSFAAPTSKAGHQPAELTIRSYKLQLPGAGWAENAATGAK